MAEVKEKQHSILMTDILAQETYSGRKTQTRRPLKTLPGEDFCDFNALGNPVFTNGKTYRQITNRYGNIGSQVAVKELYFAYGYWQKGGSTKTGKSKKVFVDLTGTDFQYKYSNSDADFRLLKGMSGAIGWYKRSSLFMPRRAARSIVEITDLRVERIQDISEADARAEGMEGRSRPLFYFQRLWNDINKARGFGWDSNPWVLAITFKKIEVKND